jgi:hypothetical protein
MRALSRVGGKGMHRRRKFNCNRIDYEDMTGGERLSLPPCLRACQET